MMHLIQLFKSNPAAPGVFPLGAEALVDSFFGNECSLLNFKID